jgi:predicted nuclease with TOPRIM domain
MRSLPVFGMVLILAMPALAQSHAAKPASTAAVSANTDDVSVEYVALRDHLADRNKQLNGEVVSQRALIKHNEELLKEAEKLDASNKKIEAEKQRLAAHNADLQKQREALKSSMGNTETAALRMGGK